jgi:hypothetical protein
MAFYQAGRPRQRRVNLAGCQHLSFGNEPVDLTRVSHAGVFQNNRAWHP